MDKICLQWLMCIDQFKPLVLFLMDVKQGPLNLGLCLDKDQIHEAFYQLEWLVKGLAHANEISEESRCHLLAYLTEIEYNIVDLMDGNFGDPNYLLESGEYTLEGVETGFKDMLGFINFIKSLEKV